jgi:hypothetical protein
LGTGALPSSAGSGMLYVANIFEMEGTILGNEKDEVRFTYDVTGAVDFGQRRVLLWY